VNEDFKYKKKCACCGKKGEYIYEPLSDYYLKMYKKFNVNHVYEFLNVREYNCKCCHATDRGRMICAFLQLIKLHMIKKEIRLLHIAPEKSVEEWILKNCSNVVYESTDLFEENVNFFSDIQNMKNIEDSTYDFFICSHVLEHVKDDQKAMRELFRILKQDGLGILLVPICLDLEKIDEEWGRTEEENWKRFAQNDHCRIYSKSGFINRLKNNGFYVHIIGKDLLGDKLFEENSLKKTSVLYVVSKVEMNISQKIWYS